MWRILKKYINTFFNVYFRKIIQFKNEVIIIMQVGTLSYLENKDPHIFERHAWGPKPTAQRPFVQYTINVRWIPLSGIGDALGQFTGLWGEITQVYLNNILQIVNLTCFLLDWPHKQSDTMSVMARGQRQYRQLRVLRVVHSFLPMAPAAVRDLIITITTAE